MFANFKKATPVAECFFDGTLKHQVVLSDSEKRAMRVSDWVAARELVAGYAPSAKPYLFQMAEGASLIETHYDLNRMEERYLGLVHTKGAWWRRKRFWTFVDMIGKGHIPRDLTPEALGN